MPDLLIIDGLELNYIKMEKNKFNIPVYDDGNFNHHNNCIWYWYGYKSRWINVNLFGIRIKIINDK